MAADYADAAKAALAPARRVAARWKAWPTSPSAGRLRRSLPAREKVARSDGEERSAISAVVQISVAVTPRAADLRLKGTKVRLRQAGAEALDAAAGLFQHRVRGRVADAEEGATGRRPRRAPPPRPRPPAVRRRRPRRRSITLPAGASSCRSGPRTTDRRRRRLPGVGQRMPVAWFSIETTRSRRSWNSLAAFGLMKSCGAVQRLDRRPLRDRARGWRWSGSSPCPSA